MPLPRCPRALSGCLLLLALLGLSGCSGEAENGPGADGLREKTTGESVTVEVNSLAPAFAANLLGGGETRLSDFVGSHVVVLEFWSIFCKSCLQEMPRIHELSEKYKDRGLAVMSVNTDVFSDARVRSVLEKAGVRLDYPILRDLRQEIAKAYNVELLPVTVIIDRSGWIRLYQEGYAPGDEKKFEDLIVKLLGDSQKEDITLAAKGGATSFAPAGSTPLVQAGQFLSKPLEKETLDGPPLVVGGGKPTALFFWSLYCRPCRAEFPALADLHRRFASPDLQICSVNVDSERFSPRIRSFLKPFPEVPCLLDWPENKSAMLSKKLGVTATPAVVLLDGAGKVLFAAQGHVAPAVLEEHLGRLRK